MADESMATALILLFDGMDPKEIGGHLHTYLKGQAKLWPAVYEINEREGVQAAYLDADDILQTLNDNDEEYTGTREHLNAAVVHHNINDNIWETLGYERDEIEGLLREQGLIKNKSSLKLSDDP